MTSPEVYSLFDNDTKTWTYIVYEKQQKNCAIIDSVLDFDIHSGRVKTTSADKLIDFVKQKGLEVEWILETHIHADHLTAASYLKEKLGGKIGIGKQILEVLKVFNPIFQSEDISLDGLQFDHLFNHEEEFRIGNLSARAIHTPGHTPADTSYVIGDTLFVGDAMLLPDVGTGRCDFLGASAEQSFESCQKIFALKDIARMYVGHDYPPAAKREPACLSTLDEQKKSNVRLAGVNKDEYVKRRNEDDKNKEFPKLLIPAVQINLRAGSFGKKNKGINYIKIPVNVL